MRSRWWQFPLILILAASAVAQNTPTYIERIDVRIANVDIVVTDRDGKVVTGLKADDFELVAGGVPQKIVNFFEASPSTLAIADAAAPAATQTAVQAVKTVPRRVILFIDNTSLTAAHRKNMLQQMKTMLGQTLSAGDETMLVTYDRALRVRIPFTSDQEAIRMMLDVVANEPGGGDAYRAQAMAVQSEILATRDQNQRVLLAKGYATFAREHLDRSINAIKEVMATVAGIDGRKVMILASEGLPVHPGMEMFQYVESLYQRELGKDAQEPSTVGRQVQLKGSNFIYNAPAEGKKHRLAAVTEMRPFDSREKIRELSRAANSYGLALYPLHGSAIAGAQTADASQGRSNSASNVLFDLRSNTEQAMRIMADQTGGRASVGSQHAELFEGIRTDLTSYYSLGFRANETGEREIKVRLKKPGRYNVRYRHTLLQKPIEQELSDRVTANLFTSSRSEESNVSMTLGSAVPHSDGKVRVPVKIAVPYDWLTLLEKTQEKTFSGGFEVYVAVVDQNGSVSPVARRTQSVVVRDLAETKGKLFPYTMQFLMNANARRVSVAVVDTTTQMTTFASHDFASR